MLAPIPALPPAPPILPQVHCDLCGDPMAEDRDVADATGLNICPLCLENALDAATFNARPTVGLVGGGYPW